MRCDLQYQEAAGVGAVVEGMRLPYRVVGVEEAAVEEPPGIPYLAVGAEVEAEAVEGEVK